MNWWLPILIVIAGGLSLNSGATDLAGRIETEVRQVEQLLEQWQFERARALAESLFSRHPDLPAVQFVTGWVKFHLGDHQSALELVNRAAAVFGDKLEQDPRIDLVRATARIARDFVRDESADGKVVVFRNRGLDEILTPYLYETVGRTLTVVGEDLGHQVTHPIVVQILPNSQALADVTGLTAREIETSGTIAVCKYGRLMITSPRATLKGFGWLDTASHELVHLIISEKTLNQTPIWLQEALARFEDDRWRADEPLHREGLQPGSESQLARALRSGELVTFEQMHPSMALLPSQEAAELAFSEVYMVARFILERRGYAGIRALLEKLKQGRTDFEAVSEVYALDKSGFSRAWMNWLKQQKLKLLTGEIGALEQGKKGRPAAATEQMLSRVKRIDLRDFFHLGQLLRARSRNRAAVVEYQKAVDRAGPDHAATWVLSDKLGLAWLASGRPEPAERAFEASLRTQPLDEEAHLHLGQLLLERDPYQAWLHLREALRINPLDPRVQGLSRAAARTLDQQGDRRQEWKVLAGRYEAAVVLLNRHGVRAGGEEKEAAAAETDGESGLRIHTRPWARVWLDFRDTGLTTPVYWLGVSPGLHLVAFQASCAAKPVVLQVHVGAGEAAVIDRDLCPEGNQKEQAKGDP